MGVMLGQLVPASQLQSLSPLVAVCVIFAGLLSVLMKAFLKHLNTKDERLQLVVQQTQTVLTSIQVELSRLAENDRHQTTILERLLERTEGTP